MLSTVKNAIGSASRGNTGLEAAQFIELAAVPEETEWFANLDSAQTRRAYKNDLREFMAFTGLRRAVELRQVKRAHVLAWRLALEKRALAPATLRRKLAALSSLFEYLCDKNAVAANPVRGVKRPKVESQEGKTPALSDEQAARLLDAPDPETLKGKRDRAILSVLLFHALRREELSSLRVKDFNLMRGGVPHLRVNGKGGKLRYLPAHSESLERIEEYLSTAGHKSDAEGALFRSIRNSSKGGHAQSLNASSIYSEIVRKYLTQIGVTGDNFGPHSLRTTAATSALGNGADIAKVQAWLGHSNISTTRMCDRRASRPADSPTFFVDY
jgi:site-specific recombinase XerD